MTTERKVLSATDVIAMAAALRKKKEEKASSREDGPNATFFPEGESTIRVFADPLGHLYREINTHGYFFYGHQDPNDINPDDIPEHFNKTVFEKKLEELNEYQVWKFGGKYNFLIWCQVIDTKVPDENWKPGQIYVAVCPWKVAYAIQEWIISMGEDAPEVLARTFDPGQAAPGIKLTYTRGSQGSCVITNLFKENPAVALDKTYKPLAEAYIRDGWHDDKMKELQKRIDTQLEETRNVRKAKGLPLFGTPEWDDKVAADQKKEEQKKSEEESKSESDQTSSTSTEQTKEPETKAAENATESTASETAAAAEQTTEEPKPSNVDDKFARFRRN